ncbi:hypothetical protein N0V83_004679 [Neocucurbitaria cava]|uniref:Uncharacterized protein n=1 Tax=Neocucurbitaria cava TaxID=798079 RepID=A0A9W9CNE6_9PLEO|nr:hypothetical protein N0V83_004679 [Neocucurbitaria cava]
MEPFHRTLSNMNLASADTENYSADLHGKAGDDTPEASKSHAGRGMVRAFSASRALQQVMGFQEPDPFVPPPAVPEDLEERFVEGLGEYGLDYMTGVGMPPQETVREAGKSKLPDIVEEAESPVSDTTTHEDAVGEKIVTKQNSQFKIPMSPLVAQAVMGSGPQVEVVSRTSPPPVSYESDGANDTDIGETTSGQLGTRVHHGFDSSTSLAETPLSYPRGSAAASGAFTEAVHAHCASANTQETTNAAQWSAFAPMPLFPSPRVEQPSEDFSPIQPVISGAHARQIIPTTQEDVIKSSFAVRQKPTVPSIIVEAPSPRNKNKKKKPKSRKRAPSTTTPELSEPLPTRVRAERTTGLPTLPLASEALWKFKFPGNTHALLTILLTWQLKMQSCYNRHPNPKSFAVNPAFPYAVTPPVYQRLVSVSFYDTSVEPHKEIRFLGPGDAAEMIYAEVDTFRDEEDIEEFEEQQKQDDRLAAVKRALGLDTGYEKGSRQMAMHHRAKTGEGRWAYILVKGNKTGGPNDTAPQLMVAWHISAVTASSTCLHSIFPDDHPGFAAPAPVPAPPLKRSVSFQNLLSGARNPIRMYKSLHSTSTLELPKVDLVDTAAHDGAQTLHRTVLRMGKAGRVPLIEGFRVDVQAFRGGWRRWGGEGKVMMWRQRE